ncbi:MAG: hypothetical protein COW66_07940 [Flavobacteriaceae bacterium CG18_big_fil_WC_8_21_14_2_50_34_36]|nr:MAG: hypothetical protein COW66_07940 [Flavobacteriaceae bacterium CG18_big_fil_WC_8_21_14_2_50_34_36]
MASLFSQPIVKIIIGTKMMTAKTLRIRRNQVWDLDLLCFACFVSKPEFYRKIRRIFELEMEQSEYLFTIPKFFESFNKPFVCINEKT